MNSIIRAALVGVMLIAALVACAQPADEAAADDGVVARFGDNVITSSELEDAVGGQLTALYQQIYQVKDQKLRQMIYDQLVEEAAAAEEMTRDEYLKREVFDKVPEPTDEQIAQVLQQYRSQLPEDEEQPAQRAGQKHKYQPAQAGTQRAARSLRGTPGTAP